ncbi:MAG: alpha/beta fold hydrolase [Ignavibacteriales bacterium]
MEIVYDTRGLGEITLLFIHCWCGNKNYWKHQVSYFKKNYKCIAVDLAGHGESGKNRDQWTMSSFAKDLILLMNNLKQKNVILVGHSIGGIIALEMAILLQNKITAVIAVDTFNNVEMKITDEEVDEFIKLYKKDFKQTLKEFILPQFPSTTDKSLVKKISDELASVDQQMAISSLKEYLLYDKASKLKMLEIPLVCINSDRFPINSESLKAAVKKLSFVSLENSGHFMMIDDYKRFNKILEAQLNNPIIKT